MYFYRVKIKMMMMMMMMMMMTVVAFQICAFKNHFIKTEAYHLEASSFPYTFETMLGIIPDQ